MRLAPSSFDLARLRAALRPFRLHWFPTLRSTSDHAAALRERGTLFAPAVVLAGRQTAGRGRGAHRWWSGGGSGEGGGRNGGGLTVTFVLPADDGAVAPHFVPLLAGLAVRRAAAGMLARATGRDPHDQSRDRQGATGSNGSVRANRPPPTPSLPDGRGSDQALAPPPAPPPAVQLKWPNDLQVAGRKLGGLLCERVRKADLIGLGLNVNVDPADAPADLRDRVTSLMAIAGRPFDMTDVLAAVAAELREVFHRLPEKPLPALLQEYAEHHALTGRRVTVLDAGGDGRAVSGRCEGLDESGRLLLRDRTALHRVIAGQVMAT